MVSWQMMSRLSGENLKKLDHYELALFANFGIENL